MFTEIEFDQSYLPEISSINNQDETRDIIHTQILMHLINYDV